MPINVVDLSNRTISQQCADELNDVIRVWAHRAELRTSTAIATLIAGAVGISKHAGIDEQSLLNAFKAAWEESDADGS